MSATAPRLAAVTGATGFLGPHVLAALAARGWRLRILARRHPGLDLACGPVEVVPGHLGEAEALARLVAGANAIVHLAGAIRAPGTAAFMAANAAGTARLAAAWRGAAPDAHFLLVSSMAAREPGLSPYAASKHAGEARLREAAGAHRGFTILRPAAVYGPGDRETLAVFRAAALPVQPLLNGPGARLCLIHAADVASAVAALAEAPGEGCVFELSDARREGYRWAEIAATAARLMGRTPRPVRVPRPALAAIAAAGEAAAALGVRRVALTRAKLAEVAHPDWGSRADAQPPAALWQPAVGLEDGFRATIGWYRARGWL